MFSLSSCVAKSNIDYVYNSVANTVRITGSDCGGVNLFFIEGFVTFTVENSVIAPLTTSFVGFINITGGNINIANSNIKSTVFGVQNTPINFNVHNTTWTKFDAVNRQTEGLIEFDDNLARRMLFTNCFLSTTTDGGVIVPQIVFHFTGSGAQVLTLTQCTLEVDGNPGVFFESTLGGTLTVAVQPGSITPLIGRLNLGVTSLGSVVINTSIPTAVTYI